MIPNTNKPPEYIKVNETKAQEYTYAIDSANYWFDEGRSELAQDWIGVAQLVECDLELIADKIMGA